MKEHLNIVSWKTTVAVVSTQLSPAAVHLLFSWCPQTRILQFCFVATFLTSLSACIALVSSKHNVIPGLSENVSSCSDFLPAVTSFTFSNFPSSAATLRTLFDNISPSMTRKITRFNINIQIRYTIKHNLKAISSYY